MNKYIGFFIVLGVFVFGIFIMSGSAYAIVSGCLPGYDYSSTTGQVCPTTSSPSITVLSPNGGESYQTGQQIKVTWKTTGFTSNAYVAIDLTQKNGDFYSSTSGLASGISNDGNEIVTIPVSIEVGDNYVITVGAIEYGISNIQMIDHSDYTFTINSATLAPSITVLSPNGGEEYYLTDTIRPTWRINNPQVGYVDDAYVSIIDLANPSVEYFLGHGESSFGSTINHTSSIQQAPSLGTKNFKLKVSAYGIIDYSDNTFTIKNPSTTPCSVTDEPSYTVLYPNGGEMFTAGGQITINWSSCNVSTSSYNTDIYIKNTGTRVVTYLTDGPIKNDGAETFNLSTGLVPGSYKAYVGTSAGGWGQSDNAFTINSTTNVDSSPRIMYWYGKVNQHIDMPTSSWVTDPDGVSGADLDMLTYCKKWYPNTYGIEEYKLETINTWRERGNVNAWTSTKMSYKCLQGETNSKITVLSPNGGETWVKGTQQTIKWKDNLTPVCQNGDLCNPVLSYYDIVLISYQPPCTGELCATSVNVIPIAKRVTGYSYLWNTNDPNITNGSYTISVCRAGLNICDSSDSYFKIVSSTSSDPYIKLLSPQSGSKIKTGSKVDIKWESFPNPLPNNRGNFIKVIIKRGSVFVRELITLNDGNEIVEIPSSAQTGKYEIEYGTISPSSGGGDHYVKYGTAEFIVVTEATPYPPGCTSYQGYSSITGQACSGGTTACSLEARMCPDGSYVGRSGPNCEFICPIMVNNGCLAGSNYSSTTGLACLVTIQIPACSSSSGAGCGISNGSIQRTLNVGTKGEDVKTLQAFLGVTADGSFGPITKAKVIEWQTSNSLTQDGVFGPMSRQKANIVQ